MATKDVIRGVNVTAIWQSNGQTVNVRFKSFRVEEEIQEGYDQVGGEIRGRPFRVTDGFKVTYDSYNEDSTVLDAFLASIANDDANLTAFQNVVGLILRFRDGSKRVYKIAGQVKLGPTNIGYGARPEAVMSPSHFRCQYFSNVT